MKNRTVWLSFLAGCLVTPVLYLLAALYSGGGHSLISVIMMFPYGMLWGLIFKGIVEWPGIILLALQFPVYGLVLGIARMKNRLSRYVLALLILHALVSTLALVIERKRKWQVNSGPDHVAIAGTLEKAAAASAKTHVTTAGDYVATATTSAVKGAFSKPRVN